MLSPREFVEAMTLPVWQAAAAVRWLAGRVANTPKAHEASASKRALSHADCVSQEILLTALRAHFPWIEIDAEEDTPQVCAFRDNRSEYRAIIDPIDGTLHYLDRDGVYAVLVGLEQHGRVEASIVAIPEADLLIRAVRGQGTEMAWALGSFRMVACKPGGDRVLISKNLHAEVQDALRKRGYELAAASGGAIGVAPLLLGTVGAVRLGGGAHGLSRRTWVSTLCTLEAGGIVEAFDGPLPPAYEAGVRGVIVAPDEAVAEQLRGAVSVLS
jgi:3'-phosphoadenosine 5'-phosphosulfate (PAPS) 3'-phosphatase